MNQERIDSYRTEVTNWISKQGFLFQIFHAPRLLGSSSGVLSYLVGVFFKLFLLGLLFFLVYLVYVATSHTKMSYANMLEGKIKSSLAAESIELSKLKGGVFSEVVVPELKMTGGEGSFFENFEVINATLPLGYLVSKKKVLGVNKVSCSTLKTHVKISAGEKEQAIFSPLFQQDGWFQFSRLEAKSFTCQWGYSEKTAGKIKNARLEMARNAGAWMVEITGGTLDYTWIKGVEVEKIKLLIKPDRFEIAEANLQKNGAQISLTLAADELGENPHLSGKGTLRNCELQEVLNEDYRPLVTGLVNTEFTLEGYPNSAAGVAYTFIPLVTEGEKEGKKVQVAHPNYFKFTHEVPLWRALTTLDSTLNYRAYLFNDTQWELTLQNDEVILKNGVLRNKEKQDLELSLNFAVKEPDENYIKNMVNVPDAELRALLQRSGVKEKAVNILKMKGSVNAGQRLNYDSLDRADFAQILRQERHFDGAGVLKLHAQSFLGKDRLQERFPPVEGGMRKVEVQLKGAIEQVTQGTAQQLYELGKKQ